MDMYRLRGGQRQLIWPGEDASVVYCKGSGDLHYLDSLSTRIWQLLQDSEGVAVTDLLDELSISGEDDEAQVGSVLHHFRQIGVVELAA